MSGININPSAGFQQQLDQLGGDVAALEAEIKKLELANQNVADNYKSAKADAQNWLDIMNGRLKDLQGNPMHFKTIQELHDFVCKGGFMDPEGNKIPAGQGYTYVGLPEAIARLKAAETAYNAVMGPTLAKLEDAQKKLDIIGGGLKESIAALKAMTKLLESGDIEGAVMQLQTSRSKVLDQQLAARIEGMQMRNAQIKTLNDQLKSKQGDLGNVSGNAEQKQAERDKINAAITGLKGDIDKLNSDSQLDMIGIQGLVNKRNEAFDMLSNLLGKFQKTIDGIVGNYR
jgi:chromosome segregation ATPase